MVLNVRRSQRVGRRESGVSKDGGHPARSKKVSEIIRSNSIREGGVGVGSLTGVSRTNGSKCARLTVFVLRIPATHTL